MTFIVMRIGCMVILFCVYMPACGCLFCGKRHSYFSTDFISLSDFNSISLNIMYMGSKKFNILLISSRRLAGSAMRELSDVLRLMFEEQPWDLSFLLHWFVLDCSAFMPLSICWPIQYSNSFWEILTKLNVLLLKTNHRNSRPFQLYTHNHLEKVPLKALRDFKSMSEVKRWEC